MRKRSRKLEHFIKYILSISPEKLRRFTISALSDPALYLLIIAIIISEKLFNLAPSLFPSFLRIGHELHHSIIFVIVLVCSLIYYLVRITCDRRGGRRSIHPTLGKLFHGDQALDVSILDKSRNGIGIRSTVPLRVGEICRLSTSNNTNSVEVVWYNARTRRAGLMKLNNTISFIIGSFGTCANDRYIGVCEYGSTF